MSRLGKSNSLEEILASIVGDISAEARMHVVEEGWTGRAAYERQLLPSQNLHSQPRHGLECEIDY